MKGPATFLLIAVVALAAEISAAQVPPPPAENDSLAPNSVPLPLPPSAPPAQAAADMPASSGPLLPTPKYSPEMSRSLGLAGPPAVPPPLLANSPLSANSPSPPNSPAPPAAGAADLPPAGNPAPSPPPLVFRTRDIVRPDVLQGKNYRLAEYAPLIDGKFHFELETPWGTIPAQGMAMLDLRLREMHAIEYAARIAHRNPMFVEGVWQVAAKTPEGAFFLVTDPVQSLKAMGIGLKRMALAKYSPGGLRANCEGRRRLACLVCCDPETHNPVLDCLLEQMSTSAGAGWLGAEAAINFGVPGLGAAAANAEFRKMAAMRSTLEIQAELDGKLGKLDIPEPSRERFFNSTSFTTTQRMAFVYLLGKLIGVENISTLVERAGAAPDEAEALASIQELQVLVELRRTESIMRVDYIGLVLAQLADGRQILVSSADYTADSPQITETITRYRGAFPAATTTLLSTGRLSAAVGRQLEASAIRVAQHRAGGDAEMGARPPADSAAAHGAQTAAFRTK